MRGDIAYRVYGLQEGREKDSYFGAFRTPDEAESHIEKLRTREMHGRNWAEQYHNRGFVIREVIVETDFEVPTRPKPRDQFAVVGRSKPNQPGTWDSTVVEVFRRGNLGVGHEKTCEYERDYSLRQTFEPFRQDGRDYALISRDYTRTAVLDLTSGQVIAEETDDSGAGFCPVGFYVPDWWDVREGSIIPGSESWNPDYEWPTGDFGFVWGCLWGDDNSWKVQYLDLSRVREGIVRRDERFGYVELATFGYSSPALELDVTPPQKSGPPPFIRLSRWKGETQVTFSVEMRFDLESGRPQEWQRLKIADME